MEKYTLPKGEDYCLHCGLCVPYCKRKKTEDNSSLCKDCSLCYSICPRLHPPLSGKSSGLILGPYQKIRQVRTIKRPNGVQDSGIVTLLVKHLLKKGWIDAALLTRRNENWLPEPFLATKPEEVEQAAGTKFTVAPTLSCFKQGSSIFKRLAVVGLPCQLAALHNLNKMVKIFPEIERVAFTIGLFCMNSFIYSSPFDRGIKEVIEADFGIPIKEVRKMEIQRGKLRVYSHQLKAPVVKSVKPYGNLTWPICRICGDFTCTCADISVGSAGSEPYANTVIVRTDQGRNIIGELVDEGLIEAQDSVDLSEVKRLAAFKVSRIQKLSPDEVSFLKKQTVRGNWLNHRDKYRNG